MPRTALELDGCELSPIRKDNKHEVTPQRTKRKTSRRDLGIDVHNSSCSTPNSQASRMMISRTLDSPSSSFPYSQDNRPDVIWDYTSPKLPKGARKKEINLTVEELLENLNQCQVPQTTSNVQPAQYVKLLENWMAKQDEDNTIKKVDEKIKKRVRKQPRRVIEELRKFIETIPRLNQSTEGSNNSRLSITSTTEQETNNALKHNDSSKSFLGGDSTDNDSTEELWGDGDNSFIVKATQELDSLSTAGTTNSTSREDVVSTIPETAPSQERLPCENRLTLDEYSEFLEQLTNIDWDSDVDEWDKGFLIGDSELSLIPDEVLSGTTQSENAKSSLSNSDVVNSKRSTQAVKSPNNITSKKDKTNAEKRHILSADTVNYIAKESKFQSLDEFEVTVQTVIQKKNAELYNSFEDESLEDESLLCQPDVLSRIDEVESLMSQLPRCTPEEIKKKKEEAIKRRKTHTTSEV